jgi:hypothetical protein
MIVCVGAPAESSTDRDDTGVGHAGVPYFFALSQSVYAGDGACGAGDLRCGYFAGFGATQYAGGTGLSAIQAAWAASSSEPDGP